MVAHPDSVQIEEQYNYSTLTKTVSSKDEAGNPMTDKDGNIITEEQEFTLSKDVQQIMTQIMSGNSGKQKVDYNNSSYYISYHSIPLKGESDSWSIITLQKKSDAMVMVYRMMWMAVIVAVFAIAMAVVIITILARKLTSPVVSITDLIGNASEGDFSKTADESNKTELGILARSFNKMTRKISNILTKTALFSGEVIQSSGKLKDIEENIETINEALHEISDGTEAQNGEVNHVVQRAAQLDETLSQVRKQSRQLLENAKNTMQSGEKGALHVHNLMKQNEKTTDMMDLSYQQIIILGQQQISEI